LPSPGAIPLVPHRTRHRAARPAAISSSAAAAPAGAPRCIEASTAISKDSNNRRATDPPPDIRATSVLNSLTDLQWEAPLEIIPKSARALRRPQGLTIGRDWMQEVVPCRAPLGGPGQAPPQFSRGT